MYSTPSIPMGVPLTRFAPWPCVACIVDLASDGVLACGTLTIPSCRFSPSVESGRARVKLATEAVAVLLCAAHPPFAALASTGIRSISVVRGKKLAENAEELVETAKDKVLLRAEADVTSSRGVDDAGTEGSGRDLMATSPLGRLCGDTRVMKNSLSRPCCKGHVLVFLRTRLSLTPKLSITQIWANPIS